MAGHHAVDAIAHGAEIAIEARHIDARIDLAGIVFARNAVDFLVDVADAALHLRSPRRTSLAWSSRPCGSATSKLPRENASSVVVAISSDALAIRIAQTSKAPLINAATILVPSKAACESVSATPATATTTGRGDGKRGGEPQLRSDRETV